MPIDPTEARQEAKTADLAEKLAGASGASRRRVLTRRLDRAARRLAVLRDRVLVAEWRPADPETSQAARRRT